MKKFTTSMKLFVLLGILLYSSTSRAQCSANFIWSQWFGGVIGFTSTSTPATSLTAYYWNFGNGATYTATGINGQGANHTYSANGTYTVTLFILSSAPSCSSQITQTISVTNATNNPGCNLNAAWSNYLGGPGQMHFNNNSIGTVAATTYTWDYGDGNTGNTVNGSHIYAANGVYTVTLYASNNSTPACVDTHSSQVTITTVCNLVASFNMSQAGNGLVNFVSTSTGTSQGYVYTWNFGDGNNGSGAGTSHNYANGSYTVTLTVKNTSVAPTCTSSAMDTLVVSSNTCFLNAGFTFTQGANGQVNFSNTSTNTNSNTVYSWNFGNGNTSNTSGNPSLGYLNGGIHTVQLIITDSSSPTCSAVTTQSINITTVSCTPIASFTLTSGGTPGFWTATPSYPWNVANAQWSWGDGFFSNTMFASHNYSVTGNYNICLTVTLSCGATASACSTYSIYRSEAKAIYHVNVVAPALTSIDNNNPAGLDENAAASPDLNIYPNPSGGMFAFVAEGLQNQQMRISVSDPLGRVILLREAVTTDGRHMEMIDLNNEPAGLYFITLSSGERTLTRKVMISR